MYSIVETNKLKKKGKYNMQLHVNKLENLHKNE